MNPGTFEVKWNSHTSHYRELFGALLISGDMSDVTLVCDDQVTFKAHKMILKPCSPIFESIFLPADNLVNNRETVYLRGVNSLDFKALLDCIYYGEASLDFQRMKDFIKVAKDLKIKDFEHLPDENEAITTQINFDFENKAIPQKPLVNYSNESNYADVVEPSSSYEIGEISIDNIQKKDAPMDVNLANDLKKESVDDYTMDALQAEDSGNMLTENSDKFKNEVISKCRKCNDFYTVDPDEEHICQIVCKEDSCNKAFTSKNGLKLHHEREHEGKTKFSTCEKCGKVMHSNALKNHLEFCGKDKEPCPKCGVRVKNIDLHVKKLHVEDDQQKHKCKDCGKGFLRKFEMKNHKMSVHLKLRPYKCRYGCAFAYNDSSNRLTHERKKHGKVFSESSETAKDEFAKAIKSMKNQGK